jgi:hypothetical protein
LLADAKKRHGIKDEAEPAEQPKAAPASPAAS